jgi:hypothetical protein
VDQFLLFYRAQPARWISFYFSPRAACTVEIMFYFCRRAARCAVLDFNSSAEDPKN